MAEIITAKVLRYDPSTDDAPWFQDFQVEWVEDPSGIMTALQVLHAINYDQEQIGYDYCCRSGLCGRCSMLIDGKAALACWTPMTPGDHTFEPLPKFPVVKDLIVDRSRAYERFIEANTSIQTVNPIVNLPDIDYNLYWNTLERLNMCRECMCCYSVCPKLQDKGSNWKDFSGPGALMAIAQRYLDTEDEADRLAQAVYSGLFICDQCGECNKVCPSYIAIVDIIAQMQEDATTRGLQPSGTAEFM
ncbi:MAG: hypothetical protein HGA54_00285 [Actinobacteria bacterium]|nr:hypothetical protein [Actinomycetota bacterium]